MSPHFDVARARLRAQLLSGAGRATPHDVVRWMGAVQAQEYADSRWALALRMRQASAATVERAFAAGAILRTHVLRPTWHFVTPADIRWMLALTGPRISAAMSSYNRLLELDPPVFRRSERALAAALRGGIHLTRQEIKQVLQRAGIRVDGVQRLAHLVMQAEIDAVICSGPRRDKHVTYALLDERVPAAPTLSRDQSVAELTRRYFISHGPAQLRDFAWWSGLRMADARAGIEMVAPELATHTMNGRSYWFSPSAPRERLRPSRAALLPLYDEYLIAYKDRSAARASGETTPRAAQVPVMSPLIVDGKMVGGWKRTFNRTSVAIILTPFVTLDGATQRAVMGAAEAYAAFLGVTADISIAR